MRKAVAVVSGGLDSVVALHMFVRETAPHSKPIVLTFDYGQPAAKKEITAAAFFSRRLGLPRRIISLPWMKALIPRALAGRQATDAAVWVPNRNGVFIAAAAAVAESLGGGNVIFGFNRDEGASFPDNTPGFVTAANDALRFSTCGKVQIISPTVNMSKAEMAAKTVELGINTTRLWSCYGGKRFHCGVCPSCKRLFSALSAAKIEPGQWPKKAEQKGSSR